MGCGAGSTQRDSQGSRRPVSVRFLAPCNKNWSIGHTHLSSVLVEAWRAIIETGLTAVLESLAAAVSEEKADRESIAVAVEDGGDLVMEVMPWLRRKEFSAVEEELWVGFPCTLVGWMKKPGSCYGNHLSCDLHSFWAAGVPACKKKKSFVAVFLRDCSDNTAALLWPS